MTLIGMIFVLLLLLTVGTGVAFTPETKKTQKDNFQFDVKSDDKVVGTLTISAKRHTYDFRGKGLAPDTTYYLICKEGKGTLGNATTTKWGTLQMRGIWDESFWTGLTGMPTFELKTAPRLTLGCVPVRHCSDTTSYVFWDTCSGKLTKTDGTPLGGQRIDIVTGPWHDPVSSTTTKSDGTYSYTRFFWTGEYYFGGHYYGDGTYCPSAGPCCC